MIEGKQPWRIEWSDRLLTFNIESVAVIREPHDDWQQVGAVHGTHREAVDWAKKWLAQHPELEKKYEARSRNRKMDWWEEPDLGHQNTILTKK